MYFNNNVEILQNIKSQIPLIKNWIHYIDAAHRTTNAIDTVTTHPPRKASALDGCGIGVRYAMV